mgnify:FL=1
MSLYVIGDLHLSLGADKPMDVFGGAWTGYLDKLRQGLSVLKPEDTIVLCGDTSWGMDLEEALPDFRFLAELPGQKLLVKGNHDYWWSTAAKFQAMCRDQGFENLALLHNNCHTWGGIALCGTRGWFYEEETGGEHDKKLLNRELARLETSLKGAGEREIYCFLHYPPLYRGYTCPEIMTLLADYHVSHCWYGHLHGSSHRLARQETHGGVQYHLIAADFVGFRPVKIG